MTDIDKQLKQIKDEIIVCKKCDLYKKATLPVIGAGNHQAKIVFIGEGPGANEDKTGVPFCGRAGEILDELFKSIGIKRKDIYITNIVKHRPPGNRDPKPEEIKACVPYLDRQIDIIKPEIICPLGRFAANYIMNKFGLTDKIEGISKIHGQIFETQAPHGKIIIIPFYHPAVVTYNINMKKTLENDFKNLERY